MLKHEFIAYKTITSNTIKQHRMKFVIKIALFYWYDIDISYSSHPVLNETRTEIASIKVIFFNRNVPYFKQARVLVVSKVSLFLEVSYKKY